MPDHCEPRITIAIDLSPDEAEDLASALARATPSTLIPMTGLGGRPAVVMASRLAVIFGRLADQLALTGYPSV